MKRLDVIAIAAAAVSLLGPAAAFAQGAPGVKQACMADVQRMCPGATPGKGWVMHCIKGRMSEVSPGCKSAVETTKANRAAARAAAAGAAQTPPGAPPPPDAPPPPTH